MRLSGEDAFFMEQVEGRIWSVGREILADARGGSVSRYWAGESCLVLLWEGS